jgi:2-oxoglutarate ferredoxin oxidoreductase subunit beta
MTGGQMAPTTLIGQKATTCIEGRTAKQAGYPIRMSEMLATIDGATYLERTTVHNAPGVLKTKAALKKAFQTQIDGKGFSMVEILSMCPTNWGTRLDNPSEATKYVGEDMIKVFPLGVYKDAVKAA